jgi:DHA2 family multidrug resistance protein
MLDRRQQYHLSRMSSHISAASPQVQSMIQGTTRALESRGFSVSEAAHKAYGLLQGNFFRQATMLAYIDNFWLLGLAILILVPFVFLMKRPPIGGQMAVH